jgi:hypothetical protein
MPPTAAAAIRCQGEAAAAEAQTSTTSGPAANLGQLLNGIHDAIGSQYEPRLQALLSQLQHNAAEDGEQQQQQQQKVVQEDLLKLATEMQQQWKDLQSACASSNSSSSAALLQAWSEGSAFDLLGLLQEALAAAGESAAHVLDAMLAVCETLCPGSDLHVFHALRWASIEQQRQGEDSEEAKTAFKRLAEALCVRYGQQVVRDEQLLNAMAAASSQAAAMVAF